jgi:uncharacterized SAM-binding protein YcdF (DUF218 family)
MVFYSLAKSLLEPFPLGFLILGIALAASWKRFRRERANCLRAAIVVYLLTLVIAVPAVSYWPIHRIECKYAPLGDDTHGARAIVVLGGGIIPADSIRTRPVLASSSSRRCLYALELYRKQGPLPIFVTGSSAEPDRPGTGEAVTMHDFLLDLGIRPEDVHVESNSLTTHDNAVFTSKMLQESGIHRVLLVTEALHMSRAEASFRKEGIDVVPAPSSFQTTEFRWKLGEFVPSVHGLGRSNEAAHEWLGYAWYWLSGKLN